MSVAVVALTSYPQILQIGAQSTGVVSVASNCSFDTSAHSAGDICAHNITVRVFRPSACIAAGDRFSASVSSRCAGSPCAYEGPVAIEISPEESNCAQITSQLSQLTSKMQSVRGPSSDIAAVEWSAQSKPIIPSGVAGYFIIDIDSSDPKLSGAELTTFQIASGNDAINLAATQDLTSTACRTTKVCVIVPGSELQKYISKNAYTTLSFTAKVRVTSKTTGSFTMTASSTTTDILSPNFSDMGATQPPYDRFSNDTIGFSIAIAAGVVVLLSALAGFAVSFRSNPAHQQPATGPAAAGAGV